MARNSSGEICLLLDCNDCCDGGETGTKIPLNREERDFMDEGGTTLELVVNSMFGIPIPEKDHGRNVYKMFKKCGHSVNGKCDAYDDPRRPLACRNTTPGRNGCNECRISHDHEPVLIALDSIAIRGQTK